MNNKKLLFLLSGLGSLLIFCHCQTNSPEQEQKPAAALYAFFNPIALADTLPIPLNQVNGDSGRVIPPAAFFAAVDPTLLSTMVYTPDTSDFQGRAFWRIALDENHEACLLELRPVWFQFKYLLIYSKETQKFTGLTSAAQLYGGDGGQIISQSWLFDLKTRPALLTRYLEHSLRMPQDGSGEVENINLQSVGLMKWSGNEFLEAPVRDSSRWILAYPLQDWE